MRIRTSDPSASSIDLAQRAFIACLVVGFASAAVADPEAPPRPADPRAAFDEAFAGAVPEAGGPEGVAPPEAAPPTPAGLVVDRFAPPVAAIGPGGVAFRGVDGAVGSGIGGVRQPCDAPGSGCRNPLAGATATPGNPPIGAGGRPTPPGPPAAQ